MIRMESPSRKNGSAGRPMSCDGKPIIDRIPQLTNGYVAAGHSMLGVSLATGTGKLLAELMTGAKPHVDANPFRAARFLNKVARRRIRKDSTAQLRL